MSKRSLVPIVLPADPTVALEAATKQYVDARDAASDYTTRANQMVHGGGTVSYSADNRIKWTARYIVMARGRGSLTATAGYFDITMPPVGTAITGVGGSAGDPATTIDGILMSEIWSALYYILPVGSSFASQPANFRLVRYTAALVIPPEWVLIASLNTDHQALWVQPGIPLKLNTSYNAGEAVRLLGINDTHVAAANKDGAVGTASMRTLGTGALQATAGGTTVLKTGDTMSGNLVMGTTAKIDFADEVGDKLLLYATNYKIGVESSTMRYDSGTVAASLHRFMVNNVEVMKMDGVNGMTVAQQVVANSPAPTLAAHLTRKDYVDAQVSAGVSSVRVGPNFNFIQDSVPVSTQLGQTWFNNGVGQGTSWVALATATGQRTWVQFAAPANSDPNSAPYFDPVTLADGAGMVEYPYDYGSEYISQVPRSF